MFTVEVPQTIIKHCKEQVDLYDFGKRGKADGNTKQQLTGIIGESMVRHLFGEDLIDGSSGYDFGEDINYKGLVIDVKTMGRTTYVRDYYVNNFIGLQKNHNTDVYIFCSYHLKHNELTIIGCIPKYFLLKRANFFKEGSERYRSDGSTFITKADLYEIRNDQLVNVDNYEHLCEKLDKIKLWITK